MIYSPLTLALRHWRMILGGLAVAFLTIALLAARSDARHWQKKAAAMQARALQLEQANALAIAQATTAKANREAAYAHIRTETADAYEKRLADARGQLARWMRDHATDHGQRADLPETPGSAEGAAGAGSEAVVPVADLSICATNTVKAETWAAWWNQIAETEAK